MARFWLLVTMITCSMPAATASSTAYWMTGLSTSGSISLGCAFVAGRKRVPQPAAGKTAFRTRIELRKTRGRGWRRVYPGSPPGQSVGGVGCPEAVLDGVERGLCSAGQVELAQDVADVGPSGPLGDRQRVGDRLVAQTLRHQGEHRPLAIGQRRRALRSLRCARPDATGEEESDRWVEMDLAPVRCPDGGCDVVGVRVLEDESRCAGLESGGDPRLLDEA